MWPTRGLEEIEGFYAKLEQVWFALEDLVERLALIVPEVEAAWSVVYLPKGD